MLGVRKKEKKLLQEMWHIYCEICFYSKNKKKETFCLSFSLCAANLEVPLLEKQCTWPDLCFPTWDIHAKNFVAKRCS